MDRPEDAAVRNRCLRAKLSWCGRPIRPEETECAVGVFKKASICRLAVSMRESDCGDCKAKNHVDAFVGLAAY